ncbi:glycosyltransferase family 1 protein [Hypoxylon sp. NC0597]|nr:glycosyltransferase family 1 protein [Hypoxylon sp. NC0597]
MDEHRDLDDSPPPPAYSVIETVDLAMQANTSTLGDDGRIELDTQSRLFKTLSKVVDHLPIKQPLDKPPPYEEGNRGQFDLKLNIVIQVVGSRGDVQPFVALGTELLRHGHRVRLATHNTFADFVRDSGLEFYPIGGDPAELMAYMVKNPGLFPSMKSLRAGDIQKKRKMVSEMLVGCWDSCVKPDPVTMRPFVAEAIIANPPSFAHIHCAQALGVPLHLMFTMPWTSTKAFPHPLINLNLTNSNIPVGHANRVSYLAVEWLTWQGLGDVVNAWRETLDLEPVPASEGPMLAETLQIPFTYCWSPSLIPKPLDWPSHIGVCGFFFRDPPVYESPPEIESFLRSGPPPIYIGFGSIVIDNPIKLTAILLQAIKRTGVRAIISRGWSNLGGVEGNDDKNVLFIGECPHEWLFQHVAAVVHHGGAGTTACGLLNGRPTTIIPFFGDQPFWGAMVASAGAGPQPIPQKLLTSENLAEAINFCLTREALAAAEALSDKMRNERGVNSAVDQFHANIPAEELRCDIIKNCPAAWIYKKGKTRMKLSKLAAEILIENLKIKPERLERYVPRPTVIDPVRWDPVTATVSSLVSTFKGMVVSTSDIVIKPVQVYQRPRGGFEKSTSFSSGTDSAESGSLTLWSPSNDQRYKDKSQDVANSRTGSRSQDFRGNFGAAVAGSASGVGGFFKHFFKGMYVDMPLAATEGFRSLPKLYGGEVREIGKITDWKSGATVGGKNFIDGVVDGVTDLIREPVKGSKEDGTLGAIKGIGKGSTNMVAKVSSGLLGLVAYPSHGICKSITAAIHNTTAQAISKARRIEGEYLARNSSTTMCGGVDESSVLQRFDDILQSGVGNPS